MRLLLSVVTALLFVTFFTAPAPAASYSDLYVLETWRMEDITSAGIPCPTSGGCVGIPTRLVNSHDSKTPIGSHNGHADARYSLDRTYSWTGSEAGRVSYSMGVATVPAMVSIGPGHSWTSVTGYADAATLRMGGKSMATSTAGNGQLAEAISRPAIGNSFTVLSGTSGRVDGDSVLLRMNLRLDGTLSAGGAAMPGYSSNFSDLQASLKITGGPQPPCSGEECGGGAPTVLDFSADATMQGGNGSLYWHPEWKYISSLDARWGVTTNTGIDLYHSENRPDLIETNEGATAVDSYSLDTGALALTFMAVIGEKYDIYSQLWVYATASGDAWAVSDFQNTLAGEITADDGTLLAWDVPPGGAPVPIPGAFLLFAPGLAGIALARRRLKR